MLFRSNWQVASAPTVPNTCTKVRSGPNRYVKLTQQIKSDFYTGTTNNGLASGVTCYWKGVPSSGSAELECVTYSSSGGSPFSKTFTAYSNSACTTAAGTYSANVDRNISLFITPKCNSGPNFSATYQAADASDPQRFTWACNAVSSGSTFTVTMVDTVTTLIAPFTASTTITVFGVGKSVTVSNMRYQPVMPSWFYTNEWYKTAFYSVAPSKAPISVTPCGTTQLLAAGTSTSVDAIVLLAGAKLASQAARPSAAIADYLEAPNVTAGTTCLFSTPGTTVNDTFDDQLVVVAP